MQFKKEEVREAESSSETQLEYPKLLPDREKK